VNPSPTSAELLTDPAFGLLKEHLIVQTGLAYYADKDRDLAGHLAGRLAQLGLPDCATYLGLLCDGARGEAELDTLIQALTIGETFFFRHRELFDALRDVVLPDVLARNRETQKLRIWSAGCSIGAEPYSVSILLRRDLGERIVGWDVTILGTDINRAFLERAREGRFEEWALRNTPEEIRRACFTPVGRFWLLAPPYRQGVTFQYHNLVTHPFPSLLHNLFAFDIILCRNVTIYFSPSLVRRIISRFCECLVDGGWLLVGHAEPNLDLFQSLRTVNVPGAVLYQKSGDVRAPSEAFSFRMGPNEKSPVLPWTPPILTWAPPIPEIRSPPAALSPGDPDLEAARALGDRGHWQEAEHHCRRVLERDKLNVPAYYYLALLLEQTGRLAEAEQTLRRVLYLDRGAVLAHYALGLLLQKKEQRQAAMRSFRNVLSLLERVEPERVFADGDGITAAELRKLAEMYLAMLEET
jgi:chemotaxis protein methyltransferase CheR